MRETLSDVLKAAYSMFDVMVLPKSFIFFFFWNIQRFHGFFKAVKTRVDHGEIFQLTSGCYEVSPKNRTDAFKHFKQQLKLFNKVPDENVKVTEHWKRVLLLWSLKCAKPSPKNLPIN